MKLLVASVLSLSCVATIACGPTGSSSSFGQKAVMGVNAAQVISASYDAGNQSPYAHQYSKLDVSVAVKNISATKELTATMTCTDGEKKGKSLNVDGGRFVRTLANGMEEWQISAVGAGGDASWLLSACKKYAITATINANNAKSVSDIFAFDSTVSNAAVQMISANFDKGNQDPYAHRYAEVSFSLAVLNSSPEKAVDVEVSCTREDGKKLSVKADGGRFIQAMGNNMEEWKVQMVGAGGSALDVINACKSITATSVVTIAGKTVRGQAESVQLAR